MGIERDVPLQLLLPPATLLIDVARTTLRGLLSDLLRRVTAVPMLLRIASSLEISSVAG